MADLHNIQDRSTVKTFTDNANAAALDFEVARYDTFIFNALSGGTGALSLTWKGVVAGRTYGVDVYIRHSSSTTDWLSPVNAASTNSDGTTLIFHSVAGAAVWPVASTTASLTDYVRWTSPDGVNFYVAVATIGLDE